MKKQIFSYGFFILLALLVGFLGSFATQSGMDAYELLAKPSWTPPQWLFPVMWTLLYMLMGISAAMIFGTNSPHRPKALLLFVVQLVVNGLWSLFFFGQQWLFFSFLWIVLLWILVYLMAVSFYKIKPLAGLLQIPYLIWLTIAMALNLSIWLMNP